MGTNNVATFLGNCVGIVISLLMLACLIGLLLKLLMWCF